MKFIIMLLLGGPLSVMALTLKVTDSETIKIKYSPSRHWQIEVDNAEGFFVKSIPATQKNTDAIKEYLKQKKEDDASWAEEVDATLKAAQVTAPFCNKRKGFVQERYWKDEKFQYSGLWKESTKRDQRGLDNCHSFGTLGVFEARASIMTGQTYDLSERDLFFGHFNRPEHLKGKYLELFNLAHERKLNEFKPWTLMSRSVRENFEDLQANGVCSERSRPYIFRRGGADKVVPLERVLEMKSNLVQLQAAIGLAVENFAGLDNERELVANYVKESQNAVDYYKVIWALEDEKPSQACLNEREEMKEIANKMEFKYIGKNIETVLKNLQCSPVGVSMRGYRSLKKGKVPTEQQMKNRPTHVPVLVGYDCDSGDLLFRNSWAASDFAVGPDRISLQKVLRSDAFVQSFVLLGKEDERTQCEKTL